MKVVQPFSLLALALTVASCNEKISPELQNGSVSSGGTTSGVAIPPSEYYFNIQNTSDTLLNFKLHKTGAGNTKTNCEVKNNTGLSSDIFRGAQAANDITCYFEAEELSLFANGMKFSVNSSPNTCEYIGYSPFSFYDKIPGDSSDNLIQVTCESDTTTSAHVATAAAAAGLDLTSSSGAAGCNDWVSTSISSGVRKKFGVAEDIDLCRYKYIDDNCDIGNINVSNYKVTYTPPGDDPVAQPATLKQEMVQRIVRCGGSIANCVKGPSKLIRSDVARFTEITKTELNKSYTKEYTLPGLINDGFGSVKQYANYRRNLASSELDFGASIGETGSYKTTFSDPTFGKVFNPLVADFYSSNMKTDGSTLIDQAMIDAYSYPNNQYKAVPLAADPFLGTAARINPFYTFYCLDTALDIKARVRMVVREWDRVFPSTADDEYISDIFKGANSRQDNNNYVELPNDPDSLIYFNDIKDWDDFIPMQRTPGSYVPGTTVWFPEPTGFYPDGFFNPLRFPGKAGL